MHKVLGMVWKKTIWHFGKVSLGLAFIFKHSKCPDDVTAKRMAVVVQGDMRICESVRINAREGYGFGIPTIFCSGWHHTWVNLKWNNMYFSISLPLKSHISQLLVETVSLTTVSQFSPFFSIRFYPDAVTSFKLIHYCWNSPSEVNHCQPISGGQEGWHLTQTAGNKIGLSI